MKDTSPSNRIARRLRKPSTWLLLIIATIAIDMVIPPAPTSAPLGFDVGGSTIAIERTRGFHGGEYHRKLVVSRDGQEISRTTMGFDTGGTVRLNVYQDGDERLILIDRMSAYVTELNEGSVTDVAGEFGKRPSGSVYGKPPAGFPKPDWVFLGAFDNTHRGPRREFRFIPAAERPEMLVESPA